MSRLLTIGALSVSIAVALLPSGAMASSVDASRDATNAQANVPPGSLRWGDMTLYVTSWSELPEQGQPGWKRIQVAVLVHNGGEATKSRPLRFPPIAVLARGFRYHATLDMGIVPSSARLFVQPLPAGFAAPGRISALIPATARTYAIAQRNTVVRQGALAPRSAIAPIFPSMRRRARPVSTTLRLSQYVTVRFGSIAANDECIGLRVQNRGGSDVGHGGEIYVFTPSLQLLIYSSQAIGSPSRCPSPQPFAVPPGTTKTVWFAYWKPNLIEGPLIDRPPADLSRAVAYHSVELQTQQQPREVIWRLP